MLTLKNKFRAISLFLIRGIFISILVFNALVVINLSNLSAQEKTVAPAPDTAGTQATEPAPATGENPTTAEGVDPKAGSEMSEAGKVHFGEDPTIWVLILLFNLALAVAIERVWVFRKNKSNNAELVNLLTEKLSSGAENVNDLSENVSKKYGVEGRVAAITLKGWAFGDHVMKEYGDAAIKAEKRFLEKRLVILSTLGNNTPFIGLLGTVLGIMKAFRDLAAMGDSGPAVVMKGISEALVATAGGLAVAIPCVIAYNVLSKTVKDKISCSEEISNILLALKLSTKK